MFTVTFSHAQSTRGQLINLHPKKFNYDVAKINYFIWVAFKPISTVTLTTPVSALFLIIRVYKQIKTPSDWLHHICNLENTTATASLKPDKLMSQASAKFNELKDHTSWKHVSRVTAHCNDEQTAAILAKQESTQKQQEQQQK